MDNRQRRIDRMLTTCRHFNGLQHDYCEAGVNYQVQARIADSPYPNNFACLRLDGTAFCPNYTRRTREEVEAEEAEIERIVAEVVGKTNAFASGDTRACPECGQEVTAATVYEKTEPGIFSLYVRPCGHRLGLWSSIPAWITDIRRVPLDDDSEYADD